jgi:voltage-gated potassium channel
MGSRGGQRVRGAASARPDAVGRSGLSAAEALAARLDRPMGALGIVFLFVVLGQNLAGPGLATTFTVIGWVLWAVFVAELALRAYVARDQSAFWRRNWWQVVFLAVPFLRVVRAANALRLVRVARVGGVLGSAVRGSRSAGRLLGGRVGWLSVVTGVVVLASSQLLYVLGTFDSYALSLHAAALATITGEPLAAEGAVARWTEVVLAAYSVAVFATLAGALGAYFLRRADDEAAPPARARSSLMPRLPGTRGGRRAGAPGTTSARRPRRSR